MPSLLSAVATSWSKEEEHKMQRTRSFNTTERELSPSRITPSSASANSTAHVVTAPVTVAHVRLSSPTLEQTVSPLTLSVSTPTMEIPLPSLDPAVLPRMSARNTRVLTRRPPRVIHQSFLPRMLALVLKESSPSFQPARWVEGRVLRDFMWSWKATGVACDGSWL